MEDSPQPGALDHPVRLAVLPNIVGGRIIVSLALLAVQPPVDQHAASGVTDDLPDDDAAADVLPDGGVAGLNAVLLPERLRMVV